MYRKVIERKQNHMPWCTLPPPPPPPPPKKKKKKKNIHIYINAGQWKNLIDLCIQNKRQSLSLCSLTGIVRYKIVVFLFCDSPSKANSTIIPVIAPMNLLGLMQGNWFCIIEVLAVVFFALPHNVIPLTHWRGRIVWPVLLKRGRPGAKCDLWILWATQGLTMYGPVLLATNKFFRFCKKKIFQNESGQTFPQMPWNNVPVWQT